MYPLLQPTIDAVVALSHAEAGRLEEARREFELNTPESFAAIQRSYWAWLPTIAFHAEACALVGDRARAQVLHDLLLPFADRLVTAPPALAYAPTAYYLALLATTLGRTDEAVAHFEAALAMHRRAGNRSWHARTLVFFAELLSRRSPAERARAVRMVADALAMAKALDMPTTLARARDLAERLRDARRTASHEPVCAALRRAGQSWNLSYGGEAFLLPPMKGLDHLTILLRHPGRDIWAVELARLLEGSGGDEPRPPFQAPLDADLDPRALREIRARHHALKSELAEARYAHDLGRESALCDEMERLEEAVLHQAATLGDDHERARTKVTKAIAKAIREIAAHHAGLGHHLKTHIVTGRLCRYQPDPEHPIRWEV